MSNSWWAISEVYKADLLEPHLEASHIQVEILKMKEENRLPQLPNLAE